MNSPDPASPVSTDSSASPPPDDFHFSVRDQQQVLTAPLPPPSGSSKRRLPGGSSSEGPQRRDPKSRRREDAIGSASASRRMLIEGQAVHMPSSAVGPAGSNAFQSRGDHTSRRDKDELIDLSLVEQLRQDFGDPFLDSGLKQLS